MRHACDRFVTLLQEIDPKQPILHGSCNGVSNIMVGETLDQVVLRGLSSLESAAIRKLTKRLRRENKKK